MAKIVSTRLYAVEQDERCTSSTSPVPLTICKRPPRNTSNQSCSTNKQLCVLMDALAC